MVQSIIKSLDIWTDAQGVKSKGRVRSIDNISLEGISHLRELILELAMRGKLVPQDPTDEPATELLQRIESEKHLLINNGIAIKPGFSSEINEQEKPFSLPDSWKWVRIRDVGYDWGQKTPVEDFSYVDVSAIDNLKGKLISPTILNANNAPSRARKIVKKGTVIYSTVRPYLKNISVISEDYFPSPIASTAFAVVHPYLNMPGEFLAFYLRSPTFVKYVEAVQMGIAYPAINDKQFFSGLMPLPPLAEQHRIVAKIEELMALCDKLESEKTASFKTHQTLVAALLKTLIAAKDAGELEAAWHRLAPHFDTLFCTEDSINQLKQTILQLAVMGRLVKQDPADKPASELLKEIEKEKEKLIEEGKMKKEKAPPEISDDEKAFALPKGWEWVRLEVLGDPLYPYSYGVLKPGVEDPNGVLLVKSQHIYDLKVEKNIETRITPELDREFKRTKIKGGEILLNLVGASIGRCAIAPEWLVGANVSRAVAVMTISKFVCAEYLLYLLTAFFTEDNIKLNSSGSAQPVLNLSVIRNFVIAVPPFVEQKRIVAKIKELMNLCDKLEERLLKSQEIQIMLSKTLVENAVVLLP